MLAQGKLPIDGLQQAHEHPKLHAKFVFTMHFLERVSLTYFRSSKGSGLETVKNKSSKLYQLYQGPEDSQ